MSKGKLIVLAASTSESTEYQHSTWRQMLLATLPQKYARWMGTDWSAEVETNTDGSAKSRRCSGIVFDCVRRQGNTLRRQEWRRGTHECVRHLVRVLMIDGTHRHPPNPA